MAFTQSNRQLQVKTPLDLDELRYLLCPLPGHVETLVVEYWLSHFLFTA